MARKDDHSGESGGSTPAPGASPPASRADRVARAAEGMLRAYRRIEDELQSPPPPGAAKSDRVLEQRRRLHELRVRARDLAGSPNPTAHPAVEFRGEEHPDDAPHRAGVAASPQPSGHGLAPPPDLTIRDLHRLEATLSAIRHSAVETCFYNLRLFAGLLAEGEVTADLRAKSSRAIATLPPAAARIGDFLARDLGGGLTIPSAFPAESVRVRETLAALDRAAQAWNALPQDAPAAGLAEIARALGEGVEQTTGALARMQARLDSRRIDLAELIETALTGESERLAAAGIAVRRGAMSAAGTRLFLEREPMLDILSELLRNAIRHGFAPGTDAADRVIELDLEFADPSRRAVRLTLADHGRGLGGIAPESLFARGVSTAGGSGEGLALARTVAESQLGAFELAPREPHGVRCTLTFPVKADLERLAG